MYCNYYGIVYNGFTCMKNSSASNGGVAPRFSSTTTTTSSKPKINVSNMIQAGLALLQSVHSYNTNTQGKSLKCVPLNTLIEHTSTPSTLHVACMHIQMFNCNSYVQIFYPINWYSNYM